jgi:hypothetical protein
MFGLWVNLPKIKRSAHSGGKRELLKATGFYEGQNATNA